MAMARRHICGISVAWRDENGIRANYFPLRHPDTENFDPAQVYRWLKDHIAAGVRFVTMNGLYDWGWLRTDGGVMMPPSEQLEEVGALAAMVDENRFKYSLDAICDATACPVRTRCCWKRRSRPLACPISKRTQSAGTSGNCRRVRRPLRRGRPDRHAGAV